jgi:acyl-coenzyme A thioesterase PaaI-like protein
VLPARSNPAQIRQMSTLQLPHSVGCLVCGRDNPHGLRLSLYVDPDTNAVHTRFIPQPHHIGFVGVIHGGVLATVADEAMVWAAIWVTRRACLAGELSTRFRRKAVVGEPLRVSVQVIRAHSRLIETECQMIAPDDQVIAVATGKYLPRSTDDTQAFLRTLDRDAQTDPAFAYLSVR